MQSLLWNLWTYGGKYLPTIMCLFAICPYLPQLRITKFKVPIEAKLMTYAKLLEIYCSLLSLVPLNDRPNNTLRILCLTTCAEAGILVNLTSLQSTAKCNLALKDLKSFLTFVFHSLQSLNFWQLIEK